MSTQDKSFYDSIELTGQEIEAALVEAKKRKYFHLKHKDYWEAQEVKTSSGSRVRKNRVDYLSSK